MGYDLVVVGVNASVILLSISYLIIGLKNREALTSAKAWKRLMSDKNDIKKVFLLFFISLLIYLVSESAELVSDLMMTTGLESIHHYGEEVHMFFALAGLIAMIPIFKRMLEME